MTDSFIVNNFAYNGAPSVAVDTPAGVQIGNVKISYKLTDTESDCCSITVEYSLDNGAWHSATMGAAGDGKENLTSSPGGVSHDFFWDTVSDNVGTVAVQDQVKVRITPKDFKEGETNESNYFSVNNTGANEPPTIEITGGPDNGSTVDIKKVTFKWQGTDPEGALAGYYHSFDHDPPNVLTNETSVESDWLTNSDHTFRVLSMDNASAFSEVASRTFTVNAVNLKPTVTILTGPSGETGDNTPTFTYQGHDNDGTIAGYYVSIDIDPPNLWTTDTSYTSSALPKAGHTFHVMAQDNDGANTSVTSRNFQVTETTTTPGSLIWAKRAGGTDSDMGYAISVLSDDSIVVTGYFSWTATFGPGEENETVLFSVNREDMFIARYNPNGTLHWARRAGGDHGLAISVLSDDSIVVTGYFSGTATFGTGEVNETVLSSAGWRDIFIARYNLDGTLSWAKRGGGPSDDEGCAISVLSDDSITVSGYFGGPFEGTATFGPGEGNETVLSSAGYEDIFIARYNPDGTLHWARHAGGSGADYGYAISVLSDDSITVSGYFHSTATFGLGEVNETALSSAGDIDVFIARYNPDGTLHWARHAGGSGADYGYAISVLSDDSIVTSGFFGYAATFGQGEGNETVLSSSGEPDIYIARYNPDGTLNWARRAGGTNYNSGRAISVLSDDSIVLSGSFYDLVTFGPGEDNETVFSSSGGNDIFIARYNPDGTLHWAKRAGGTNFDLGCAISVFSDDSIAVSGPFQDTATFGQGEVNETVLSTAGTWDIFIARYSK
jgi:uncharacterized delta-60 repeat protein